MRDSDEDSDISLTSDTAQEDGINPFSDIKAPHVKEAAFKRSFGGERDLK